MKILYVGKKWDYGKKEQGEGFEQVNIYGTLIHMGFEIVQFDFMEQCIELGREEMNRRLIQAVRDLSPDLVFTVLFTDQIFRRPSRKSLMSLAS